MLLDPAYPARKPRKGKIAKDTVLQKDPEYRSTLYFVWHDSRGLRDLKYSMVTLRSSSTSSSVQTNKSALFLPLDLPRGVLPKDLGGGVRCASGNPYPISDQTV